MPWTAAASFATKVYSGLDIHSTADFNGQSFNVAQLFDFVGDQTNVVNAKLSSLKATGSSISITDMFEMQMKMNRLSQFSEMATSVVSAANTAISSIARNVK